MSHLQCKSVGKFIVTENDARQRTSFAFMKAFIQQKKNNIISHIFVCVCVNVRRDIKLLRDVTELRKKKKRERAFSACGMCEIERDRSEKSIKDSIEC
jgi:hypothetical protein